MNCGGPEGEWTLCEHNLDKHTASFNFSTRLSSTDDALMSFLMTNRRKGIDGTRSRWSGYSDFAINTHKCTVAFHNAS